MINLSCLGGCNSKLGNQRLQKILKKAGNQENLTNEDCSIFALDEKTYLVESLDFFPMVSDDLYNYGKITACNAISDVYAMGAKPIYALNILSVPKEMEDEEIVTLIQGMNDVLNLLAIPIKGGHTIVGEQLLAGLAVTGLVQKDQIKKNNTNQVGDWILISKPLGTGTVMAAKSVHQVNEETYQATIQQMTTPNNLTSEILIKHQCSSLTDITGFGLAGHLLEMLSLTQNSAQINVDCLPLISGVKELLNDYIFAGASASNRKNYWEKISFEKSMEFWEEEIFFDPQTSGGLLATINPKLFQEFSEEEKNQFWVIGKITKNPENLIQVVKGQHGA